MLTLFTTSWRRRTAILAVVFYALGAAAPVAAFAVSAAGTHCVPQIAAADHAHADSAHADHHAHHDDGHAAPSSQPAADDPALPGKCCGAFCLTALAPAHVPVAEPALHFSAMAEKLIVSLIGHQAGRIDRPPRNLPPL